jgi:outer membrane protein OmpA-like peptidoglycan-associated protein
VSNIRPMLGVALAALLAAGSASAQDRWDWSHGGSDDHRGYRLAGPGVDELLPELRDTQRGQAFVINNFDFSHDGFITVREARAANRAFAEAAGPDRGHFNWDARAHDRATRGGWDRQGMRNYHFRQGHYGAMLTLQDVLFETGSAVLRPGAEAQLQPLAGYLDANPRVRLRIDGFTDSVGSDASNLTLSRNRAQAVADALAQMGVDSGRFQLEGHGKALPAATNDTVAGRQLNRRVEVTLVGQRASSFD